MADIDLSNCTSLLPPRESEVEMHWIVDTTSQGSQGWHVPLPLLEAQGYGRASTKVLSVWLPKQAYKPLPLYNHSKQSARSSKTSSSKCQSPYIYKSKWVPQYLLKAQQYYTGATTIWIPREKQVSHKESPQLRHVVRTRLPKSSYQWKPKKPQPIQVQHVSTSHHNSVNNPIEQCAKSSSTRHAPTRYQKNQMDT